MQVELKPCPFCESRVISEYRDGDYWIIKCAQCGAEIAHTQHQKACFAWNRRHQARAEVVGEIVAWLREEDGHGYDDMRADIIEAKFGGRGGS